MWTDISIVFSVNGRGFAIAKKPRQLLKLLQLKKDSEEVREDV
jgi:hypothetical protein